MNSGGQVDDLGVAGADHHRGDGAVEVGAGAVGVFGLRTAGTVDVLGLAGKVTGAVQSDELGAAHGAHLLEQADLRGAVVEVVKDRQEVRGRDRIEQVADVVVRGDAIHPKERGGVVGSASLAEGGLMGEEGGALGEEDRQGGQDRIGHLVDAMVALAGVGEGLRAGAQPLDQVIEGAQNHEPQECLKAVRSTSYDCVTMIVVSGLIGPAPGPRRFATSQSS